MWRATVKSLLARKVRLALTALSIVLGVGFVAGTFVLTDTTNRAFDQLFATAASKFDLVVRSKPAFQQEPGGPGGGGPTAGKPVPGNLIPAIEAVPGVASASGDVGGYAQVVDPATGKAIGGFAPTLGSNFGGSGLLTLRAGSAPSGPGQVAIDAATADRFALRVGERIHVLFQGPPGDFTISGIVTFGSSDNLLGATLAVFDTPTAQRVFGKPGAFDAIDVRAAPGVSPLALQQAVSKVLPAGVQAATASAVADEQAKQLKTAFGFLRIALLVFAFISLFVGAFLIFNTFSIIVAQRTRELALLRALGAYGRQVMGSVLAEALLTGLAASTAGVVAGLGIAVALKALLNAFSFDLPKTGLLLVRRTVIVSLAVGTLVTVVASFWPARRAARVAPVQALRESAQPAGASFRRRAAIGGALTAAGVGLLLYGLFAIPSNAAAVVGFGAELTFVGVAVLSPLVARQLARAIGAPLRGLQGRLGRENAMRNPRRTASTASALMIGLGLVSMVTILAASLKASFDAVLAETLKADFAISTTSFTPFSTDVAARLRDLPELAAVSEFRAGQARIKATTTFVTAVDSATIGQVATIDAGPGAIDALARGDLVVLDDTAAKNGWSVGDVIPVQFESAGTVRLTIGGTFGENRLVGANYLISLDSFEKYFTGQLDTFVMVKDATGVAPAVAQRAMQMALKDFPNVQVQDQTAFRRKQAGFVNQLLGLVTALLAMAILIALFGIANTLGLSIYERTRELGMLRAIGMSRTQVKRTIRWESVIIAVLGALLGIGVGVFFGWSLQRALAPQGVTELAIPGGQLAVYVVLAGLAGVVAAIVPARRAAKLDVLAAIAYE